MLRGLCLMGLMGCLVQTASAEFTTQIPVCDVSHDQVWTLPGEPEPAILRTRLISDGSNFPFATRELIFHDGEKLELWGAGKIIDDYDGDFPSCDEHIERLAENSLANITQPRRMSDLSDRALQVIANPDLCTDRDGDQCFEGDDVSFFMLEVDPQDLTLLIEQDAMLIELLHSAYSYSTYGYDSGQRRLVELYGSGC